MNKNITMKDIADKLGVSKVTVSKALNDKDGVSEELKIKIKMVAEDMGYRYNALAKSLKVSNSYNIGVIIAERFTGDNRSFYLTFYQYISRILEEYHYSAILNILDSKDEERLNLPRIYNQRKVDGFIILGQVNKGYIELLQNIEMPIIFLDFYDEHIDIDTIITDNFYGAYEITNYLIKNGHRQIGYVGNLNATSSIQDRFLGYYKSLLEHRIKLNEEYIINDRDEKGKFIDLKLPDELPTAFVCNCDMIAYNLIKKLNDKGYKVPEDCSVVGFDNDIYATISDVKITTVEVDMEEMAKTAVRCIIEKMKNTNEKYGRISIKGNIVFRNSVKSL
ncbi:LacI family transcriptional regulator [Vallitalea longa]|uniref:LacI family transcriptional regulator n=1 Tax=Vallitalea longa TaxID=2936439 RepID=A0A9W6DEA9_9FIRM|nr:substrate-binding domain-containing protein [Vallitalea longa]GKX29971.1 LacI family transcriptional regulator [Vallitalea longa]